MKRMAAASFKAHCLAVMDEVQAKRETVVITKHGRPVAKLVPADKDQDEIYNYLRGKGAATDDVISPSESPSRRRASRTVSPDEVGQLYEGRKVRLTVKRVPEGKTWEGLPWILLEGDRTSLEWLADWILAQAAFEKDCGDFAAPDGPGNSYFNKRSSEFGIYIHRLPCLNRRLRAAATCAIR